MRKKSAVMLFALLAAGVLTSGCLEAVKTDRWRYDEGRDEFRFLTIWEDLRTTTPPRPLIGLPLGEGPPPRPPRPPLKGDEAVDRVLAVYRNRGHLLKPNPMSFPLVLLTEPAGLRLGNHEWAELDLGCSTRMQDLDVIATSLPLDEVRILPGELYTTRGGGAGYYHQIVLPGKTLDAILAQGMQEIRARTKERLREIASAILAQRKAGMPMPVTWQAVKKYVDGIDQPSAGPPPEGMPATLLFALSDQTLALYKDGELGRISVTRERGVLRVRAPMSEGDAMACVELLDSLRAVAARSASGLHHHEGEDPEEAAEQARLAKHGAEMLATVRAKVVKEGLAIDVDLKALSAIAGAPWYSFPNWPKDADEAAGSSPQALAMSKALAQKVKLKEGLTRAAILKAFASGALKAAPVEEVKPGEGLGEFKRD